MKNLLLIFICSLLLTSFFSCKKKSDDAPAPSTTPAPVSDPYSISYKKNGVINYCHWSAADSSGSFWGCSNYYPHWSAYTHPYIGCFCYTVPIVGTHSLAGNKAYWNEYISFRYYWSYQGTLTITSLISDKITGTFEFEAVDTSHTNNDTVHITEGVFTNLPIH